MRGAGRLSMVLLLLAGCEEPPSVPPPTSRAPETPPEVDRVHVATLRADRQIIVPNLLFVVQRGSPDSTIAGLTLMTSRPSPEGSRLIFGTSQNLTGPGQLAGLEMRFGGASLLDIRGNGIFMTVTAYQPKFVTIVVNKVLEGEVSGTISGEFYRFRAFQGRGHPEVVRAEGTFRAVLIVR